MAHDSRRHTRNQCRDISPIARSCPASNRIAPLLLRNFVPWRCGDGTINGSHSPYARNDRARRPPAKGRSADGAGAGRIRVRSRRGGSGADSRRDLAGKRQSCWIQADVGNTCSCNQSRSAHVDRVGRCQLTTACIGRGMHKVPKASRRHRSADAER